MTVHTPAEATIAGLYRLAAELIAQKKEGI
jgi:hypothetical protein